MQLGGVLLRILNAAKPIFRQGLISRRLLLCEHERRLRPSVTKLGRRAANRDPEGDNRRDSGIAVVFMANTSQSNGR
jgi:hypothetical protein